MEFHQQEQQFAVLRIPSCVATKKKKKKKKKTFGLLCIGVTRFHMYPNRPKNNFIYHFLVCILVLYSV